MAPGSGRLDADIAGPETACGGQGCAAQAAVWAGKPQLSGPPPGSPSSSRAGGYFGAPTPQVQPPACALGGLWGAGAAGPDDEGAASSLCCTHANASERGVAGAAGGSSGQHGQENSAQGSGDGDGGGSRDDLNGGGSIGAASVASSGAGGGEHPDRVCGSQDQRRKGNEEEKKEEEEELLEGGACVSRSGVCPSGAFEPCTFLQVHAAF